MGLRKKIQLLICAPNFISVIVLAGMVIAFLSPVGPINAALGIQSNLMTDPAAFRPIYIISGIWQGIAQLFAPAMESDYNYPPIFFDMDTTDRITQIETDLKPYAESQKASWIMNGGAAEEWDDCIARLNEMNLPELLQLKQTGLDAYFASMGR